MQSPTHRAVLMLAYAGGLRIQEVLRLRVEDIDSKAGVIHVRGAKRNRDRDAMLSARLRLPPPAPTTCALTPEQHRTLFAIERCRTAALGGHLDVCTCIAS